MAVDVIMPALGMAQDSGLIVSWLKSPGDIIKKGEALFEVETDKATLAVEATADGYLSAVAAQAGDDVPVGRVIARIVASEAEVVSASGAANAAARSAPVEAPASVPTVPAQSEQSRPIGLQDVIMPALGMAQDSGLIVSWLKNQGDAVAKGDPLFEVETDKATLEVEAQATGFLSEVAAKAGESVAVGKIIARIVTTSDEIRSARPATGGGPSTMAAADAPTTVAVGPSATTAVITPAGGRILASPKARRLAAERGLDLRQLQAAGHPQPYHVADLDKLAAGPVARADFIASPSVRALAARMNVDLGALAAKTGRTTLAREDVLGLAPAQPAQPVEAPKQPSPWDVDHTAYGLVRKEKLSRFALISARNLVVAHNAIPSVTHHDSADLTKVEAARAANKAEGRKITALAFHVAVLARCLREFPRFNASLSADGESLILKDFVHIGIAVDTPYGLIVPVIRDADRKTVLDIGAEIGALAAKAQDRKLRPTEMGGASMSISNLGGIGGEAFTPIINPPELAILGITRTEIRPVWDGSAFKPTPMVPLDLTYDHRVINGADAARFLSRYRVLIADIDGLFER